MQLIEDARLESESFGEFAADGVAGVLDVEFREGAVQHGFADDEFTDKIHDGVNACGVDAERALGNSGDRGGASSLIRGRGTGRFYSTRGNLGGLGFEKVAEEFVLGRFGVLGRFDADLGNDRGNFAAVRDVVDRMLARDGGFDDFDGSGGEIVLWAQGDDRAASVQGVANQLEGSGAHGTVGINAQSHVEDAVAAEQRFGNHETFVLAPVETGWDRAGGRFAGRLDAFGGAQQFLN